MFFTYLRRELRRRRKAALVVASGLALGIALVIVVNSVSSGMGQAQDKVLQSLYGLGTDMTVTKAADSQEEGQAQGPQFRFGARDSGSDEEQSSDRVMVQGFETLASSTVAEVGAQDGVSNAVGGLSLQVIKVSGQFTRGQFQQGGGGDADGGQPSGRPDEGRVQGGGADSADLADTVSGSLSTASDLATSVGKWLSIVVLAAAFLVAGLLTSAAVSRRVREFGTLKALGWRSGRVTRQVVGEAVVNGLVGGVLGIALGLAGAYVVTAISPTLQAELGGGGGTNGPGGGGFGGGGFGGGPGRQAAARTLDVALTAPVSVTTIALAVGPAVTGGLVAGAFGGWRASRLRPADALRRVE
ncbi:ABC transporter permease [Streptomyces sp. TRM70350]|uniref:ABC transporter permease n=1 Tax=Streptomyces sp. TRM70350 TaxID=2856165 RepID=UPI001C439D5F|nr:ABC transporter permease [Streptomyces sp. TRM70350]MBV7699992.1 ABC transporter permease [Streptomyces sp. TRM70350]